ncbi:MAG TPA: AAA family ATPase [Polyangiaceae bacterium]
MGKTRLADELTRVAAERGMPSFWGRCWEAGGAPAYWPWLEVIAALADSIDESVLAETLGDGAAAVGDLVPAIGARIAARSLVPGSADEARFRLFRAVSALIRRVGATKGVLLALEDLHAADESSLLLLRFVARELRGMRAVVLATFRDVEARLSAEVGEALGRLTREGTSLSLPRLVDNDADRFVRERVGGDIEVDVLRRIVRRSEGNPLFLDQMADLVRVRGSRELASAELPTGVRDVIRERLRRVSPEMRRFLDLAAVAGDEVDAGFIAEAAGAPLEQVSAAFAAASATGVLAPRERGRYRFSHALMREVLDRDLAVAERCLLHGRVAAALERRTANDANPPYAELAHHWFEARGADLSRAVDFAVAATDRALALFAFEDAVSLLERARTALEETRAPSDLEARVAIAAGRVHIRRGAGALGQELCLKAAAIARARGDAELLCQAALAYGLEITAALVNPKLIALLQEALAALPEADSPLRVKVTARLAAALQPHPDLAYPIGLARSAIDAARRIGDESTLLEALFTGMSAMMDIVDPRERLPLNLEAEQLASSAGDTERLLRTQARLVFDHMELADFGGADARIDVFDRIARESGAERYLWRVPLFRSMRAMIHGRFNEAEELVEEANRLGHKARDPQFERTYIFHYEGLLRAWERHADMMAYDPDARRMRAALYSGPHWQNGGTAFTYARLEDLDKAALYVAMLPEDDWPLVHNPPAFAHLGEPLALVGNERLVRLVYHLLLPASHRSVSWGWTSIIWDGPATRVLGMLAARLGMWDAATAHFEQAIATLQRVDAKPYLHRTRYEYGRTLLRRNAADEKGRTLVALARDGAASLEMSGLVALAEGRLADVGEPSETGEDSEVARPRSGATTSAVQLPFAFVGEGEYWTVSYQGNTFRLRHSLGVQYLARLFAEPGRAIHVLDLSGGKAGDDDVVDTGDAGEVLDDQARANYRTRFAELREELDDAQSRGDLGRLARAREEMEFLSNELTRAVGLGGRARRAGGAAERARSAVQRRIRNALDRIRQSSPSLADLLERTVKTGTHCAFLLPHD